MSVLNDIALLTGMSKESNWKSTVVEEVISTSNDDISTTDSQYEYEEPNDAKLRNRQVFEKENDSKIYTELQHTRYIGLSHHFMTFYWSCACDRSHVISIMILCKLFNIFPIDFLLFF